MQHAIAYINGHYITFPVLYGSIENSPLNYNFYDAETQRAIIRHLIDHAIGEEDSSFHVYITSESALNLDDVFLSTELLEYLEAWNYRCSLSNEEEEDSLILYRENNQYIIYNTYENLITIDEEEVDAVILLMHATDDVYNSYGFPIGDVESRI